MLKRGWLAAVLLLVGCATTGPSSYMAPTSGEVATIVSVVIRDGIAVKMRKELYSVDDRFVDVGFWIAMPDERIAVPAGPRRIGAKLVQHRAMYQPLPTAKIFIDCPCLAGKTYTIDGEINVEGAKAWLVDEAGQRVTEVATGAVSDVPLNTGSSFIILPSK